MKKQKYLRLASWFESLILRAISTDENLRYSNYSHMRFELEHPDKVKPFFDKKTTLLKKNPLLFYKFGFYFLLFINFILLIEYIK